MNLRKLDIDTLRSFRETSLERIAQVDKELDRRYNQELMQPKVETATVSQLAAKEDVQPNTIVDRCKRAGIPVSDKDGNPTRRGVTAYVNVGLYYEHYRHLTPEVK